ncbi:MULTISPECIES: gephyrin-like molybdotransferase Glp [unclassified Polaromonas]|jgi:molybdopterin molybdotransferase|uniref:molybdopterin molybdotransferase MoeA n=1 Tax=unclassified Polaromonas TaxID=2638319 RepID=UPI000BCDB044|nr:MULTISPECIES: gephyrin-like molybdotransferase Glp [unclassified Polaromonas]OYY35052.1 MAG: molybdopterin molybdenumtransferase MoeA [Polaromonas sp. 35-63-35]OYZ20192.1 MAG: molybdopterin molybdenumtransferase MoeA [Polaromonas sp. 16-63-31]OYZ77947.1 MAG: molybdopterin molybdenumtransferase MoeA [Polaromonas sp. 24-63-21]OZA49457.1 MAG: molybdopterin molybdenumtransferase MoeA [Polaromonas sp. 17-63-33]OZA87410.1 MAG: molybdopterin molybdenumtransferase MoeA [Polaromonas sp. 39-63-25]
MNTSASTSPTAKPATRPPLKALDEALAELLGRAAPLAGSESVSTFDADGRVLAEAVVSALQVPPEDNSAMDGYAVRSAELADEGVVLRVSQRIAAGSSGSALEPGTVARIFTGAPIPAGADAVVMQEDCEPLADREGYVSVRQLPKPGQWIRRAGEDVTRGATVLSKGERLTPAALGLAASIGMDRLQVARRPRVALFSTGDELVMPGEVAPAQMRPGAIYNSNRFFLRALLLRLGCEVSDLGIVPDQRDATLDALRSASQAHDLILTSGGVSVGEEDHIKPAVQQLGSLDLWQIAMKPGKPFAYGRVGAAHFMGLPGNPVSSFLTFLLLVRPFLLRLQGVDDVATKSIAATAHFTWPRADKRREFLRVQRNAAGGLDLFPNQSSGVLTSAVWGDGVVDNPSGQTIAHGDTVRFIAFSEWLA